MLAKQPGAIAFVASNDAAMTARVRTRFPTRTVSFMPDSATLRELGCTSSLADIVGDRESVYVRVALLALRAVLPR